MSNTNDAGNDPRAALFFKEIVEEAFATIIGKYLVATVRSKTRIDSDSAEILIYFDPDRGYKGYFYRLQVREGALWRKSFYTNQTHVTPVSDNVLVKYDFSLTTPEIITADFASQYRDDRATKPLDKVKGK